MFCWLKIFHWYIFWCWWIAYLLIYKNSFFLSDDSPYIVTCSCFMVSLKYSPASRRICYLSVPFSLFIRFGLPCLSWKLPSNDWQSLAVFSQVRGGLLTSWWEVGMREASLRGGLVSGWFFAWWVKCQDLTNLSNDMVPSRRTLQWPAMSFKLGCWCSDMSGKGSLGGVIVQYSDFRLIH